MLGHTSQTLDRHTSVDQNLKSWFRYLFNLSNCMRFLFKHLYMKLCAALKFLLAQVKPPKSQEHLPIYSPEVVLCVEIYDAKFRSRKVRVGYLFASNFACESIILVHFFIFDCKYLFLKCCLF